MEDCIINTYVGANEHKIYEYKDYCIHLCNWKQKGKKENYIISIIAPKFMIKWFKLFKLDFTLRANKPNIHLKPINDKNGEICIFSFSNVECSPFKTLKSDNQYDLRPYMKEFNPHNKIIDRIKPYLN